VKVYSFIENKKTVIYSFTETSAIFIVLLLLKRGNPAKRKHKNITFKKKDFFL
jgi:hypothetical protein